MTLDTLGHPLGHHMVITWARLQGAPKHNEVTHMSDTEKTATEPAPTETVPPADPAASALKGPEQPPGEIGGPDGPEPTRYGDWAFKGRCSDF